MNQPSRCDEDGTAETQFRVAAPLFGHQPQRALRYDPGRIKAVKRLQELLLTAPAGRGFTLIVLRELEAGAKSVERQTPQAVARMLSQCGKKLNYGEHGASAPASAATLSCATR